MDDPMQHAVTAWSAFGLALAAIVGQAVKYVVDALKERSKEQTASSEKIALAKVAVANEQDKAALALQVAVLTEKTARCEDGHRDCQETNAKLHAEHSQLWRELAAVKSVLPPMPPATP